MKLKEGMYVRTNEGKITKLVEIDEDGFKRFDKFVDFTNYEIIGEPSYNIIDLIEVGDYVNGMQVVEIGEYQSIRTGLETYARVDCSALLNCFYEEDIKSIVTKEQFENMSYKVGD